MARRARAKVETSAGGVVLRTIDGVVHALLIRDPYKKWGLPKGHPEKGEGAEQAALREVREETGLQDVRIGAELVTIDWTFRAEGSQIHKYTTFYLMYSDKGDPRPEKGEGITGCRWVALVDAAEKVSYENAAEVMKAAQRAVLGNGQPPSGAPAGEEEAVPAARGGRASRTRR